MYVALLDAVIVNEKALVAPTNAPVIRINFSTPKLDNLEKAKREPKKNGANYPKGIQYAPHIYAKTALSNATKPTKHTR